MWRNPINDAVLPKAVVQVEAKIFLSQMTFIAGPGAIQGMLGLENIPCVPEDGGCVTSQATYLWDKGSDYCSLRRLGEVRGEKEKEDGRTMFTSTDGSALHLEVKDPISECGRKIHPTNKPELMLYPIPSSTALNETAFSQDIFRKSDSSLNPSENVIYQTRVDYLIKKISKYAPEALPLRVRPLPGENQEDHPVVLGRGDIHLNSLSVPRDLLQAARNEAGPTYPSTPAPPTWKRGTCMDAEGNSLDEGSCSNLWEDPPFGDE